MPIIKLTSIKLIYSWNSSSERLRRFLIFLLYFPSLYKINEKISSFISFSLFNLFACSCVWIEYCAYCDSSMTYISPTRSGKIDNLAISNASRTAGVDIFARTSSSVICDASLKVNQSFFSLSSKDWGVIGYPVLTGSKYYNRYFINKVVNNYHLKWKTYDYWKRFLCRTTTSSILSLIFRMRRPPEVSSLLLSPLPALKIINQES